MAGICQIKVIGTDNTEELILLHQEKQHMTEGDRAFLSEHGLQYCIISHIYTVSDFFFFFFFPKMPHLNADRLVGIVNVFAM